MFHSEFDSNPIDPVYLYPGVERPVFRAASRPDLDAGRYLAYVVARGHGVRLQVIRGEVEVGGQRLRTSDGLALEDEATLDVRAVEASEIVVFDLG